MKYRKLCTEKADIKTALVLSGGGAKGAYQVGVVKELSRMDISFDLITGTSIGALNAALIAEFIHKNMDSKEICYQLEQAWYTFEDFLTLNISGFLSNLLSPLNIPSIYTNKKIRKKLYNYIPRKRRFSDYKKCQLSVTGTNLSSKRLEIFDFNSTIPVVDAVVASMSYPIAFPALNIQGEYFIDGGALSNAPLKEAIQWGARDIFLVFLRPISMIKRGVESKESYKSALEVVDEFLDMAVNHLMYGDLKQAEKINDIINIMNKYEDRLPPSFIKEMRKLYNLKYKGGKRIINVKQIAPNRVLDPPGLKGFDKKDAIKNIIWEGEKDSKEIFL